MHPLHPRTHLTQTAPSHRHFRARRFTCPTAAFLALGARISPTQAQTSISATWKEGTGAWSNAAAWTNDPDRGGYPNNGDGFLYHVFLGNGTATITQPITISSLKLTVGTITGSSTLTILGDAILGENNAGFEMSGPGATVFAGPTAQRNSFALDGGRTPINTGTYLWTTGYLHCGGSDARQRGRAHRHPRAGDLRHTAGGEHPELRIRTSVARATRG